MFDLPRSSWDDYDKSLISEGGGVYSREQKESRSARRYDSLLASTRTSAKWRRPT